MWSLRMSSGNLAILTEVIRFEVFTAVTMKNAVVWDVVPCRYCVNRRFGGIYHIHFQNRKILEEGTSVSRWLQTESPVENTQLGDDTFIRNVGLHNIYTTPYPRRRHSFDWVFSWVSSVSPGKFWDMSADSISPCPFLYKSYTIHHLIIISSDAIEPRNWQHR
jgi:hypothetical protein